MTLTRDSPACAPGYMSFGVVIVQSREQAGTGDVPSAQYGLSAGIKALQAWPAVLRPLLVLEKAFSTCILPPIPMWLLMGRFSIGCLRAVRIHSKLSDHQHVVELLLQLRSTVAVRGE